MPRELAEPATTMLMPLGSMTGDATGASSNIEVPAARPRSTPASRRTRAARREAAGLTLLGLLIVLALRGRALELVHRGVGSRLLARRRRRHGDAAAVHLPAAQALARNAQQVGTTRFWFCAAHGAGHRGPAADHRAFDAARSARECHGRLRVDGARRQQRHRRPVSLRADPPRPLRPPRDAGGVARRRPVSIPRSCARSSPSSPEVERQLNEFARLAEETRNAGLGAPVAVPLARAARCGRAPALHCGKRRDALERIASSEELDAGRTGAARRQPPEADRRAPAAVQRVAQFGVFERLFSCWHVLHVPLVYMMVLSAIAHVVAVHMY